MHNQTLLKQVEDYYSNKLQQFGCTAKGVDWGDEVSQKIRFKQLSKIITLPQFSVIDYGCGYGAFYKYLIETGASFTYTGYDVSDKMIEAAKQLHTKLNQVLFTSSLSEIEASHYVMASGIFNVKLGFTNNEWEDYIVATIETLNKLSTKAFAFNMLPPHTQPYEKKEYLYFANPDWIKNKCTQITNAHVQIIANYNLFEFTVQIIK
jgi:SAM-dependent methyltransferase